MHSRPNNTHVARAAKADNDARRRALRISSADPRTPLPSPLAPSSADDIILDAFLLEMEMDQYISILDRLGDSLESLANTRAWKLIVRADAWVDLPAEEWIDLSAEELRRLSDE